MLLCSIAVSGTSAQTDHSPGLFPLSLMAAVDTEESKLLFEAEGTSRLLKAWEEKQTNKP